MPLSDTQRADFDRLVRSSPVVLFMKGSRRFPQCGFSQTVVGILDQFVPTYETVNILADQGVRDGMKEYSSWPTFPQLYVHGEFVGGCDIVKDLHASGELQSFLGAPVAGATPAGPAPAPRITVSASAARAFVDAGADAAGDVLHLEIDAEYRCDLHFAPARAGDVAVTSEGVTLHLDRASAGRAEGLSIDFVQTPSGMAFKIDNPSEPPRVKRLSALELKERLDRGAVHLFDVRPAAERAVASIPGAYPLEGEGLRRLAELPRDAAIALHCHHGMRSRSAAEGLLREGYTNVYNVEGGVEAWSQDVDASVPRY